MSDMSTYEYNLLNEPIGVFGISDIPTIFQISPESKECPICFELIDGSKGSVTTSCGHCFCCECFAQSIDHGNGNCAICRHELTQSRNTNLDINTITDTTLTTIINSQMEEIAYETIKIVRNGVMGKKIGPYTYEDDKLSSVISYDLIRSNMIWETVEYAIYLALHNSGRN